MGKFQPGDRVYHVNDVKREKPMIIKHNKYTISANPKGVKTSEYEIVICYYEEDDEMVEGDFNENDLTL